MNMRPTLLASIALASSALSACATPEPIRNLADRSAVVLNAYRTDVQAVADQQTRLNADNDRRLRDLAELRNQNQAYVTQRLSAFGVAGDKSAAEVFEKVAAKTPSAILADSVAISSLTPPPASATATYDPAAVNAIVKQLKAVGKEPSRWDQIAAGLAYAKDLRAAYKESLDASAKEADAAANDAQAVTKSAAPLSRDMSKVGK